MDIHRNKQETSFNLGATHFATPSSWKFADWYGHPSPVEKFNVIIDTTGSAEAFEKCIPLLADSGRYILVGQPRPGEAFKIEGASSMFAGEGKHIMATQGGGFRPSTDIQRYVQLWRSGALNLEGLVSHRIGLDEINDGIELVRNGQAGRVMVMLK